MYSLDNIYKSFDNNQILKGVSLEIPKNKTTVLIGPSGSGKTTLLNIICGSIPIDSGRIIINGKDISRMPEFKRQRTIGRVYQNPAMGTCPNMTILENMSLADNKGKFYGLGRGIHKGRKEHYRELLRQLNLGLEDKMDVKVGTLSGGQRQRVAIARALTMEPELLVADEPIASLDASIQAQIVNLFRHLQKEHGFSFLFIAHDLDMVEFLCDRVGVMYHGKLVETGPARAVFENPLHPYTKALIAAIPIPDPRRERARAVPDFSNTEFPRTGTLREVEKDHFVLMEGGDAG